MPPSLSEKIIFIEAIGYQESGGHYGVVNSSSGALGKYQVMPANLNPWLRECHLGTSTAYHYLHTPALQDELAKCKLGGDYDTYGVRGAASVWYSGQPNWRATYGNPPVYQYVNDVIAIMRKISGGKLQLPAPVEPTLPPVKEANWSGSVTVTRKGLYHHMAQIHNNNRRLRNLLYHSHLPR